MTLALKPRDLPMQSQGWVKPLLLCGALLRITSAQGGPRMSALNIPVFARQELCSEHININETQSIRIEPY